MWIVVVAFLYFGGMMVASETGCHVNGVWLVPLAVGLGIYSHVTREKKPKSRTERGKSFNAR